MEEKEHVSGTKRAREWNEKSTRVKQKEEESGKKRGSERKIVHEWNQKGHKTKFHGNIDVPLHRLSFTFWVL